MDTNITIATIQNVPRLVELINSAYRGESSKAGWSTEAPHLLDGLCTDEKQITTLLQDEHDTILICVNEKSYILGCLYLQKRML
jgi:hypothetical protein